MPHAARAGGRQSESVVVSARTRRAAAVGPRAPQLHRHAGILHTVDPPCVLRLLLVVKKILFIFVSDALSMIFVCLFLNFKIGIKKSMSCLSMCSENQKKDGFYSRRFDFNLF